MEIVLSVLSPASASRNDASHPEWILLGYLAESFIYIRDWYREAMSIILCTVIRRRKEIKGRDTSVKREKTLNKKNSLSVGVGANWNR
jgi:hypothetical protein